MPDPDRGAGDALTIGEVIALLREEFPDVSISKVRFLEAQGMLHPARSDSGYRQFDRHDVDRLRFILRQQRDHFLPLKVIKSKLTLWERGEEPDVEDAGVALLGEAEAVVGRDEVLRRSGLTGAQLDGLVEHGLVECDSSGNLAAEAVTVAVEARRLLAAGLEARHLRGIRHAAEREADILVQLTAALSRVRTPEARQQMRALATGTAESVLAIHRALLLAEVRRIVES